MACILMTMSMVLPDPHGAWAQMPPTLEIELISPTELKVKWSTNPSSPLSEDEGLQLLGSGTLHPPEWQPIPSASVNGLFREPGSFTQSIHSPHRFFRLARTRLPESFRGKLTSMTLMGEYSVADILSRIDDFTNGLTQGFPISISNGAKAYRITYQSPDLSGSLVESSGVVFIPTGVTAARATASYQHGTLFNKADAPSLGASDEFVVGLFLAGSQYICTMPDFLGFGASSDKFHPYLHAQTEASSTIDLLRAARQFLSLEGIEFPGKLFLMGYSQGGHATMATHREMELNHATEFTVTASSPMAGPHSMSGVTLDQILSDRPFSDPFYLAYLIFSYNEAYGLFSEPSEYFLEPFATVLPGLFASDAPESQINALLPKVASQFLKRDLLDALKTNPEHAFRQALAANDTFTGGWRPAAPIRMYHCKDDEVVPYAHSEIAANALASTNGPEVRVLDPRLIPFLQDGSHIGCVTWALVALQGWVNQLL